MILTKPIVSFDLETTDPDPIECAIFEYGATLLLPDGTRKNFSKRFKPWKPITPEAEEVTGVTNAMVEDCPPFSEYAERILKSIQDKDLMGFNIRRFDLVCLDQELRRCGFSLDLTGVRVIDVQAIYFKANPRSLSDAVKQYCGRDHADAHGAGADADATLDVWQRQLLVHGDIPADMDAMAEYARLGDHAPADIAGKLYRDAEGVLRFGFGKHKDRPVIEEPGYFRWMSDNNFPGSTLDAIREELERS